MVQIIDINTYVDLQRYAVQTAIEGLTGDRCSIRSTVTSILNDALAFSADDVSLNRGEIPSGWGLGTDLVGASFDTVKRIAVEMFLDGIIQGKPIAKNTADILQVGFVWGREKAKARAAVAVA